MLVNKRRTSQDLEMKILLSCLFFISCNMLAFSAEIFAWKTPLSLIASEGVSDSRVKRLEKPPEASPFFGPKDEIWDLSLVISKSDRAMSDPPEWIVWNATTQRIVAKVSWAAFFEMHLKWNLSHPPVLCRLNIDIHEVAADGLPPDPSKTPKHGFSVIARSGQNMKSSHSVDQAKMSLESEVNLSDSRSSVDFGALISASLTNGLTFKLDTRAVLANESPFWLARTYDGKAGIDIMITASTELADGTPFSQAVMRQEGDSTMPFPGKIKLGESGSVTLGGDRKLIWYQVSMLELLSALNIATVPKDEMPEDPFAPVGAKVPRKILDEAKLKTIDAPDALVPHVQGQVFDMSDAFGFMGLNIPKEDLIGYDYKNQRVFIYSSNIDELDKFEALFMVYEHDSPQTIAISLRDKGQLRLMSRSGAKSSIETVDSKSKQTRSLQVEPILGETDTYIDFKFTYQDSIEGKITNSMDSAVTLENGKALKVLEKGNAGGSKEAIEVNAEIIRHHR